MTASTWRRDTSRSSTSTASTTSRSRARRRLRRPVERRRPLLPPRVPKGERGIINSPHAHADPRSSPRWPPPEAPYAPVSRWRPPLHGSAALWPSYTAPTPTMSYSPLGTQIYKSLLLSFKLFNIPCIMRRHEPPQQATHRGEGINFSFFGGRSCAPARGLPLGQQTLMCLCCLCCENISALFCNKLQQVLWADSGLFMGR